MAIFRCFRAVRRADWALMKTPSLGKPPYAIRNPQSAIRNPQSAIECVKIAAASLAVAGAMGLPSAHAADGTITITGEITDTTCKIESKDPPHDLMVTLPKISSKTLKNVNDTAGATVFAIRITDCPEDLSGSVKLYFEPGPTTDYGTGNLIAYAEAAPANAASSIPDRSGATVFNNVQIQLANLDGSPIMLGKSVAEQAVQGVPLSNGSGDTKQATLRYLARYIRTSDNAITAGKLLTYVQYTVVYP
ncbi:fimbrial protein [Bordetella hinzii 5132]|nr:fimbrial protein [Bordetella hinzii 5132]